MKPRSSANLVRPPTRDRPIAATILAFNEETVRVLMPSWAAMPVASMPIASILYTFISFGDRAPHDMLPARKNPWPKALASSSPIYGCPCARVEMAILNSDGEQFHDRHPKVSAAMKSIHGPISRMSLYASSGAPGNFTRKAASAARLIPRMRSRLMTMTWARTGAATATAISSSTWSASPAMKNPGPSCRADLIPIRMTG